MLLLVLGYLLFVKYGRIYMEKRAPLQLKFVMMVYNFALVLLSLYIASEVSYYNIVMLQILSVHSISYLDFHIKFEAKVQLSL